MKIFVIICFIFFIPATCFSGLQPDFTTHKFGQGSPVVLIVGGIQGDEPGGFSAAALLATQYNFITGSVWVVPNLNFHSIIERSRGLYGDMNRKFAKIQDNDPEYDSVRRIKSLICQPQVDIVLNLHDGSGFYRPVHENQDRNPKRWGQSIIIDLERLSDQPFGEFMVQANRVAEHVNKNLLQAHHKFYVRNTRTNLGDPEMERCLTWFAVRNNKPAYAIEASKSFTLEGRVYYHLQAVEAFLHLTGIKFSRNFPLTLSGIRAALQSNVSVAFAKNSLLPLEGVRPRLSGLVPVPRSLPQDLMVSSPILAVTGNKNELKVYYGNRLLTKFTPEWYDHKDCVENFNVLADGKPKQIKVGDILTVTNSFLVEAGNNLRINAIGADKGRDESNITLYRKDFRPEYSVDSNKTIYRVEAYDDKKFMGMFLVRFGTEPVVAKREYLPNIPGTESDHGM